MIVYIHTVGDEQTGVESMCIEVNFRNTMDDLFPESGFRIHVRTELAACFGELFNDKIIVEFEDEYLRKRKRSKQV